MNIYKKALNRDPNDKEITEELNIEIEELHKWKEVFAANKLEDIESVYDEFSIWFYQRIMILKKNIQNWS